MAQKSDAKFNKKLISCLENDMRIWQNFTRALESLKIQILMGSFYTK